jgi:putative membrane protein
MANQPTGASCFSVKPTAQTHFSWMRTRMSLERTLMSWVRTATALIGFGFTIVQFFEHFKAMSHVRQAEIPDMPRYLGLALIGSGVVALAVAVWQYLAVIHYLRSGDFASVAATGALPVRGPLLSIVALLGAIGTITFVAVLLRAL